MSKPLDGMVVADFSHVLSGPFASYFLALLGAEVVKIESPSGDNMRNYGADSRYHGMSGQFIAANGGKRSIILDLKSPEGSRVAKDIIARSDVLVENFRPGAMDRLGLGFEDVKKLCPEIIYCSISGYGQTGPKREFGAIDNIIQATSGMMDLNAGPDGDHRIMSFPVVDSHTGTTAALAIVAAIVQRNRDNQPQHIDVAMIDSAISLLSAVVVPYAVNGERRQGGKRGFSGSPGSGLFMTRDGRKISIGVVQDHHFRTLCGLLERPDLASDNRFDSIVTRVANGPALVAELEREFAKRDADHWEDVMNKQGLAAGVVRDVASVLQQEDLHERQTFLPINVPGLPDKEDVTIVNVGFRYDHDGPSTTLPPPRKGEHSEEILAELGYSKTQRDALLATGAVQAGA